MSGEPEVTIDQQIAEVARELAMRERCYPKWIHEKRMLQKHADKYLGAMRAVLETLKAMKENAGA